MAHLQNTSVHEVARSGPGLVFLTYPELVLSLPGSFIWAILFFAMLLVLGVDTEFCSVESLITGIVDNWSDKLLPHRKKVALGICVTLFLLGIPMCTNVRFFKILLQLFLLITFGYDFKIGRSVSVPTDGLLLGFRTVSIVDLLL